ncbi:NUDIX hydrolase [Streptacidiphilus jiangxiensis]|uniref:8-oxo-dGTP diphosphatase n=1 Tax=Streptacidiphilus jiangxiensis TaxID=235985 RepID=A0A1H7UDT7_STRJI|nr:NUDIX domain-containing protein [Streptacidiphilus jiangxiensis]SEL95163.1 8-oxo-dGTP diphosphatase [Streptacidiphilus jiangxiensis]
MDAQPDRTDEAAFLAAYDPRAFPAIALTVDIVVLTLREGRLNVLLVERAAPPFRGCWALPGGFVKAGEEGLDEAAARELAEETGLSSGALRRVHLEQLGSYGAPERDPRMHVVSVAYLAFAPDLPDPRAGGDAARAVWTPVAGPHGGGTGDRDATGRELAFDHARILADALDRARAKLEYTPLATTFLAPEFTIPELRTVYEEIWGEKLHPGNFHRKVLSVPGFVESTGETAERGGSRGGPRARIYRAGDARLLHPALLRPDREEGVR